MNPLSDPLSRRKFLKSSLASTAAAGLTLGGAQVAGAAERARAGRREFYELRRYRLAPDQDPAPLVAYLTRALVPALNRQDLRPVGVFTDLETSAEPAVHVLIPFPNLAAFGQCGRKLAADGDHAAAGRDHLEAPKDRPAFARLDSWLLQAFAGMPRIELPAYCQEGRERIFELRTYQSHSEVKAQKKVDMFNDGEIQVMKDVGLGPIFFGQTLVGQDLPHLIYLLSAESRAAHQEHWGGFGKNPVWNQMKDDSKYADTVSKITNRFLRPAAGSQI